MTTANNYPIAMSFENAVTFGAIAGATSGLVAGYVATSATTSVPIRATTYAAQGANAQRSIASSSANDTAAGTGARTVTVTYLDTTLAAYNTETLTMNGTTSVSTVGTNYAYLENIAVTTTGSTGGNVGTLSFFVNSSGGGGTWGSVAASDNHTYWCHHYVLSGQTCYITNITASATVEPGHVTLQVTGNPGSANVPQQSIGSSYSYGGELITGLLSGSFVAVSQLDHSFRFPITRPGPDFIFMNARPTAATASTTFGSFEFVQF